MGGTGTLDIVAEERESLLRLACSASAEHRLVLRARLVWDRLVRGLSVSEVARMNGVERATVRSWEQRYREGGSLAALRDRKRTGRPPGFGMREQATVLGLSCQRPEDVGRIEACMTQEIIVEEAAKQSVVVSRSTVQRILALAEVKPYRERYYLFTVKDRPEFISRRDAICTAYTRLYPSDEVLVCIDEKTGSRLSACRTGSPTVGVGPPRPASPAASTSTTSGTGRGRWSPLFAPTPGSWSTPACSPPGATRAPRRSSFCARWPADFRGRA